MAVRRARGAVTAIFFLNGLLFGAWAARIPAVRERLELSEGQLGLALAFLSLGALLAMPLTGALASQIGSRRTTRVAFSGACLVTGLIALAPTLPVLVLLAFLFGMGMGALDVAMNLHGVTVEQRYGRPILAGLHASYSFGGLAGAAVAALAASRGVDERVNLSVLAALCLVVGVTWSRRLLAGAADAVRGEPLFAWPPRRLWALGALAFACLVIEGASADWSGIYLRDELGASAGVAALGFAAFSVTMTLGRLMGDRLLLWLGPVRLVSGGGVVAGAGFGLALLLDAPVPALAGFACLGAGMASIVPIVFRAGGQVPGLTPALGLAAVTTMGYVGFLLGPPLIGGLAELVGLPLALSLLVVLAVAVAALASTTKASASRSAGVTRASPA
jgi:fucose permease